MTTELTIIELIEIAASNVKSELDLDSKNYVLLNAVMEMERSTKNYASALNDIERRADGWKYGWDSMHEIVSAQERMKFWQEVVASSSKSRNEEDLTVTVEGLTSRMKAVLTATITNYNDGNSTSGFSNATAAVVREMNSRLLGNFGSLVGLDS